MPLKNDFINFVKTIAKTTYCKGELFVDFIERYFLGEDVEEEIDEKLKETIRMLPAKQAPHCIRNHRERKSTVTEKVLLLVRTFSEKYQRAKIILSNLGRILRINFPTTCREYKTHFQPSWSEV